MSSLPPFVVLVLDTRIQEKNNHRQEVTYGKNFWVYILASQRNGTLYTGVTSGLIKRIWKHKEGYSEFTKKYNVKKLVYFEKHDNAESAINKEKLLKFWKENGSWI